MDRSDCSIPLLPPLTHHGEVAINRLKKLLAVSPDTHPVVKYLSPGEDKVDTSRKFASVARKVLELDIVPLPAAEVTPSMGVFLEKDPEDYDGSIQAALGFKRTFFPITSSALHCHPDSLPGHAVGGCVGVTFDSHADREAFFRRFTRDLEILDCTLSCVVFYESESSDAPQLPLDVVFAFYECSEEIRCALLSLIVEFVESKHGERLRLMAEGTNSILEEDKENLPQPEAVYRLQQDSSQIRIMINQRRVPLVWHEEEFIQAVSTSDPGTSVPLPLAVGFFPDAFPQAVDSNYLLNHDLPYFLGFVRDSTNLVGHAVRLLVPISRENDILVSYIMALYRKKARLEVRDDGIEVITISFEANPAKQQGTYDKAGLIEKILIFFELVYGFQVGSKMNTMAEHMGEIAGVPVLRLGTPEWYKPVKELVLSEPSAERMRAIEDGGPRALRTFRDYYKELDEKDELFEDHPVDPYLRDAMRWQTVAKRIRIHMGEPRPKDLRPKPVDWSAEEHKALGHRFHEPLRGGIEYANEIALPEPLSGHTVAVMYLPQLRSFARRNEMDAKRAMSLLERTMKSCGIHRCYMINPKEGDGSALFMLAVVDSFYNHIDVDKLASDMLQWDERSVLVVSLLDMAEDEAKCAATTEQMSRDLQSLWDPFWNFNEFDHRIHYQQDNAHISLLESEWNPHFKTSPIVLVKSLVIKVKVGCAFENAIGGALDMVRYGLQARFPLIEVNTTTNPQQQPAIYKESEASLATLQIWTRQNVAQAEDGEKLLVGAPPRGNHYPAGREDLMKKLKRKKRDRRASPYY